VTRLQLDAALLHTFVQCLPEATTEMGAPFLFPTQFCKLLLDEAGVRRLVEDARGRQVGQPLQP
jgi:hypothetical protein